MAEEDKLIASKEIHETLGICNFCIRSIGISLIYDIPQSFKGRLKMYLALFMTSTLLVLLIAGEYAYIIGQMMRSELIEDLISSNLHIAGYGTMSLGKLITIWYKRHTFRQLVDELADIWPASLKNKEAASIKRDSLSALKQRQVMYTFWNVMGVLLYNLTPIAILIYHKFRGVPSQLGYVWQLAYPFDKTKPIYHELAYVFETCAGVLSVCNMLGSDLLFMTMASHISMLLRLLQVNIRNILNTDDDFEATETYDCYKEIMSVVKIHQRLINYINDLEDAFAVVNLINVLLSSVNICCVVFTIVFLEPWMEMSNKFFLGAALTQMGIVCWYADDIYRAISNNPSTQTFRKSRSFIIIAFFVMSIGVADAVYESGWYRSNAHCRRALLLVLQRSQKPLYFTALKFREITMTTYSSILTTAYSYFTLLYTSYRRD